MRDVMSGPIASTPPRVRGAEARRPRGVGLTRWAFAAVVAACVPGLGLGDSGARGSDEAGRGDPSWREAFQCGPNALYMFLRFHGWSGSLRDIRKVVPVRDRRGCSLESLRSGAGELGVATQVVRTNCEGLGRLGLPAITHHVETGTHPDGHYYLIVGLGERMPSGVRAVTVIDPIEAIEFKLSMAEFERSWTTYALVRARDTRVPLGASLMLSAAGCTLLASTFSGTRTLVRKVLAAGRGRPSSPPAADASGPGPDNDGNRDHQTQ